MNETNEQRAWKADLFQYVLANDIFIADDLSAARDSELGELIGWSSSLIKRKANTTEQLLHAQGITLYDLTDIPDAFSLLTKIKWIVCHLDENNPTIPQAILSMPNVEYIFVHTPAPEILNDCHQVGCLLTEDLVNTYTMQLLPDLLTKNERFFNFLFKNTFVFKKKQSVPLLEGTPVVLSDHFELVYRAAEIDTLTMLTQVIQNDDLITNETKIINLFSDEFSNDFIANALEYYWREGYGSHINTLSIDEIKLTLPSSFPGKGLFFAIPGLTTLVINFMETFIETFDRPSKLSFEDKMLHLNMKVRIPHKDEISKQLKHVSVWGSINYQELETLFSWSQLETLKLVNMSWRLGDHFEPRLPDDISKLTALKHLNVESNELISLPAKMTDLKHLEFLNAWDNPIESLPEGFERLQSLKWLSLDLHKVNSSCDVLFQLKNLTNLYLTGAKLEAIPYSIQQLTELQSLGLRDCNIHTISEEIGQLQKLIYLDLSDNHIVNLPDSLFTLSSLEEIDLSNNQLISLSSLVGNLTSLVELKISNNQLTELPATLFELPNLKRIDCEENPLDEASHQRLMGFRLRHSSYVVDHEDGDQVEDWMTVLWAWADQNNIPDLSYIEDRGNSGFYGIPRNAYQLKGLTTLHPVKEIYHFYRGAPLILTDLPQELSQLRYLSRLDFRYCAFINGNESLNKLVSRRPDLVKVWYPGDDL